MKNQNLADKIGKVCVIALAFVLFGFAVYATAEPIDEAEEAPITAKVTLYDVPIDIELLNHIQGLCCDYEIPVETVLAVIEKESNYNSVAVGDNGNSKGLMQIQERWHKDRMQELSCTDLFNPLQNVTVGMNYLAELIEKYDGNIHKVLTAYCYGENGANKHFFSKAIYQSEYSRTVLEIAENIKEGMTEMFVTDDPHKDFDRWDAEQTAKLDKLPVCSECDNPIQTEEYYEFNDEPICPECLQDNHRKWVEDYIE